MSWSTENTLSAQKNDGKREVIMFIARQCTYFALILGENVRHLALKPCILNEFDNQLFISK